MFKTLLIPLDGSPLAEQAVERAITIAKGARANVDLVMVHSPFPFAEVSDVSTYLTLSAEEEKYLASVADRVSHEVGVVATHAIIRGTIVDAICRRAREIDAELIVMTSHGRTGWSRLWMGSIADGVLRRSSVPVLMVRPVTGEGTQPASPAFTRILVPLDGSALALQALQPAAKLARSDGARIILYRVVIPAPAIAGDVAAPFLVTPGVVDPVATEHLVRQAKRQLSGLIDDLAARRFRDVESEVVVSEQVVDAIIEGVRHHQADAVAMSTRGRGASRVFIGSVADKVIRATTLPMLLLRPMLTCEHTDRLDAASVVEQLPAMAGA